MCVRGCVGGERERERKSVEAPLHPRLYKCTTALCPLPTTTACRADHSTSVHSNFGSLSLSLSLSSPFVVFLPTHPPPRFKSKAGTKTIGLAMYIQTTLFLLVTFSRYVPSCTPFSSAAGCGSPRPPTPPQLFTIVHTRTRTHAPTLSHSHTHAPCTLAHSFLRPMNMFFAGKCLNLAILAKILHKVNGQMGKQSD